MTKTAYVPSNQPKLAPDWYSSKGCGDHFLIADQNDKSGKTIALVYTNAADADLIVRAVNSYAAMVEAIEETLALIREGGDVAQSLRVAINLARA